METIILASNSGQRQEYFKLLGLPFKVIPSGMDEIIGNVTDGKKAAETLAVQKAKKVNDLLNDEEKTWVAGADTLIYLDGKIYGKPENREHAREMLYCLRGRTHEVITAVALINSKKNVFDCCSASGKVTFSSMDDKEIEWYLDTNEWEGAAGSYKIQGLASCFISRICGSYSSIVGLPLYEFYVMLRHNGYLYGYS